MPHLPPPVGGFHSGPNRAAVLCHLAEDGCPPALPRRLLLPAVGQLGRVLEGLLRRVQMPERLFMELEHCFLTGGACVVVSPGQTDRQTDNRRGNSNQSGGRTTGELETLDVCKV
eukprot:SAG22_NODE_1276_length_4918_cov_1.532061_3_plen_115_part_00